jgi:uncharacterized protein (TIGR03790 family)
MLHASAHRLLRSVLLPVGLLLAPVAAEAQTAENVLLVINEANPDSITVGDHYARVRGLAAPQIVRLTAPAAEAISRTDYEQTIETPISRWLWRHQLQDRVLFIVLAKGVPLRIDGTAGQQGTVASVDSELTLLYRRMLGARVPLIGRVNNPWFLADRPMSSARRFTREDSDLYLVTRLDGYTVDDVVRLIDRGVRPSREGRIVLDQRATGPDRGGDLWLDQTSGLLHETGHGSRAALETTRGVAELEGPVLGYYSWGSNDPSNQRRQMGLAFAPGAIGGMFVSTDGRTFREPGTGWTPAPAGSTTGGQSLAADLIREGITGISAHVAEPYLDAIVRPQILFPAYLAGFTLAETYYLSMPYLGWQTIVIGDPLCAPFQDAPVALVSAGIDPRTDLPALFSARTQAQAAVVRAGLNEEAVALELKASSWRAQGRPEDDIRGLLEQATALEPALGAAQQLLAEMHEARQEYGRAAARYEAILRTAPDDVIALNNLAYLLADRLGRAADALPLAERAYRASGQSPLVADTVGWVHHRMDNDRAALPLVERAASALPLHVEIQVHAAAVHAALGSRERARGYLDAALKADPKAASREDFKAVVARIGGLLS